MKKKITQRPSQPHLLGMPNLPEVMQRIYTARGIVDRNDLAYGLDQLLPFHQLSGIDQAVLLLYAALQQKKRIVIVGDFDVDGATGTAVAYGALQCFGAAYVGYCVPNRFDYGYGLSAALLPLIGEQKPDMLITVDNGISSIEGVRAAKKLGLQVLVTDHHLPGEKLPEADVIVNPNVADDAFPSKAMAGVGVIFYVMLALRRYCIEQSWFEQQSLDVPNMAQFLDLVALGTVADLVPLDKNNRVLVQQGMQRMRAGKARPGIKALMQVAGREHAFLRTSDLGFALGPRLNAAGRLQDMSLGVACLLAEDDAYAVRLATELDGINRERRSIESDMKQDAYGIVEQIVLKGDVPWGLCLYEPHWHQGIVGLVASKIKEQYYRPTVVFAKAEDGYLKGSGRSIPGLHLRDLLAEIAAQQPDLITKFGGHAMAAGLSIRECDMPRFVKAFALAAQIALQTKQLSNDVLSDGELDEQHISLTMAELIEQGGPWGQGFEEPMFHGVFGLVSQRLVGEKHLKVSLQLQQSSKIVDGIAFYVDTSQWPNYRCKQVEIAYRLDINRFMGTKKVQLIIEYLVEHETIAV